MGHLLPVERVGSSSGRIGYWIHANTALAPAPIRPTIMMSVNVNTGRTMENAYLSSHSEKSTYENAARPTAAL